MSHYSSYGLFFSLSFFLSLDSNSLLVAGFGEGVRPNAFPQASRQIDAGEVEYSLQSLSRTIEFGTIEGGKPVECKVRLKSGEKPKFQISQVMTTCGCVAARLKGSDYIDGNGIELHISVNRSNYTEKLSKAVILTGAYEGDPNPLRFTLIVKADVLAPVEGKQPNLQVEKETARIEFELKSNWPESWDLSKCEITSEIRSETVRVEKLSATPKNCTLLLDFSACEFIPGFKSLLHVRLNRKSDNMQFEFPVPVEFAQLEDFVSLQSGLVLQHADGILNGRLAFRAKADLKQKEKKFSLRLFKSP